MVNRKAIRFRLLTCYCYMVCAGWIVGVAGCDSKPPARQMSASNVAKSMQITMPEGATNVRSHAESLFTLTCVLSIDISDDEVESFLRRNGVLPDQSQFAKVRHIAADLEAVGNSAPWWDLKKHKGCVFAESRGQREMRGKKHDWWAAAALAPLSDKRIRVFIAYVEEAAVEQ